MKLITNYLSIIGFRSLPNQRISHGASWCRWIYCRGLELDSHKVTATHQLFAKMMISCRMIEMSAPSMYIRRWNLASVSSQPRHDIFCLDHPTRWSSSWCGSSAAIERLATAVGSTDTRADYLRTIWWLIHFRLRSHQNHNQEGTLGLINLVYRLDSDCNPSRQQMAQWFFVFLLSNRDL